jgi:asparagine synthetase B (glutamine-hydrolysing)
MANSVEARVPFLSHHLVESLFHLSFLKITDLFKSKKPLRVYAARNLKLSEISKRKKKAFYYPIQHDQEYLNVLDKLEVNSRLWSKDTLEKFKDILESDDNSLVVHKKKFSIVSLLLWEQVYDEGDLLQQYRKYINLTNFDAQEYHSIV